MRQEGDVPTPSSPNTVGSPSNTFRESAYIYGFHALFPPPTLFATSYVFFVLQVGYFNRAKRCAVHRNALPACFAIPFTNVFSRLSCPAERNPEGAHIICCCRHPSFQLEGVPLPRVNIPVAPARLSGDLLCRRVETLNPGRPLRHPEFPPTRRYFPSHLSDEDPHDSSLLRRPFTQVPFAYKVDGSLFPCSRSQHRSTPIHFRLWSHAQVGQYSSWQCP